MQVTKQQARSDVLNPQVRDLFFSRGFKPGENVTETNPVINVPEFSGFVRKCGDEFTRQALKDNRERFRTLWGKPSYCYHSEFYYHCWLLDLGGKALLLALTAKGKGSSYELVEKLNGQPVANDLKTVKKFFREVICK